jgi:hypothetical protein
MTCDQARPLWPLFHAGAAGPERDDLDAHLLDCRACLERYLATKRLSEDAPLSLERPSSSVREKLRGEVAALAPRAPARLRYWALGLSAAAAALAALALALAQHRPTPKPNSPLIDADQAESSLTVL